MSTEERNNHSHSHYHSYHEDVPIVPNSALFNKISSSSTNLNKSKCALENFDEKTINYKNIAFLRGYTSENGRILPRRMTGISRKKQNMLQNAIKVARKLGLLPYTDHNML